MIRNPAVAGQFYPGSRDSLLKEVDSLLGERSNSEDAIGMLSPHAGYVYSGPVAGAVFAAAIPREIYIVLGPNHTGLGLAFGVSTASAWKTPLGDVKIDKELAGCIKKNSKHVKDDDLSHQHEHSIEVQLPFLQCVQKNFKFVPIVVSYAPIDVYRDIGAALADSIKELKLEKKVTIIASSDMTHYESQASAAKKDNSAIEAIFELDEGELVKRISDLDITMCGFGPAAIMIAAVKLLGAGRARLVRYATSGDVSGDYSSVVGYAGMIVSGEKTDA